MSQIIDRRLNPKHKSAVNRQRFLKRFRRQIRKAVSDAVDGRSITDTESGERVNIPAKDLSEPEFRHGPGGRREIIHPGNKEFVTGDRVPRPQGGAGRGNKASNQGEGQDDFVFELSRDEFLEFFFEDLELPDLVKTRLAQVVSTKSVPAGFSKDGIPPNLHVVRSLKEAHARRIALTAGKRRRLRRLEAELEALLAQEAGPDPSAVEALEKEIARLKRHIGAVPFIDTLDLRYRNRIQVPRPTTQAVMFCLMDVSGSMDQFKKSLAKRFFILLYLFLSRNYERTDVVFIRHHTIAKEVDEEEFFYSRETGGTVVSSALVMLRDIIRERYPVQDWNLYAAQASDGDNWPEDSGNCGRLLEEEILPCLQYFAYIEIDNEYPLGLWQEYEKVAERWPNFAMRAIDEPSEIYPVFRELFRKRGVEG